jgi:hypothetical protein
MANSHRATFNGLLQDIATSFAKYVSENKEKITDMTEDDMITVMMGVIDAPRVPQPMIGMSGLAPSLNAVQPVATKTTKTRAPKATKDAPQLLWLELDDYKKRSEEGQKLCAYMPERSVQENRRNRVCGAKCEDATIEGVSNALLWRCVSCKEKPGVIQKRLEGNKKPSPKVAVAGTNIAGPMPVLPGMPKPISNGIFGNMAVPGAPMPALPMPIFSGLPPQTLPEQPVIPKTVTPKRLTPKKVLEPAPVPTTPDTSDDEEAKVVPAPAPAPTPEPAPAPEEVEPQPATWEWIPVPGLSMYYTSNQPGYKKVLFKFDQANTKMYSVGRINADISADALKHLVQLNDKEQNFVKEKNLTYSYEGPAVPAIPALAIPGIPGLPGLPGIPGL